MELVLDTKKIAVVVLAFVLMAAGIVYLALPDEGKNKPYSGPTVDNAEDFAKMSWEDVLAEANGQTVTLGILNDIQILKWVDEYLVPVAADYGVKVQYGTLAGYAAMNADKGLKDPMYDMYWVTTGMYGYSSFFDNWWSADWKGKMPNSVYLSSTTDDLVSYYNYPAGTRYVGNQVEFSGADLMFAYNTQCSDPDQDWDTMKLTRSNVTKTIKVIPGSTGDITWAGITNGGTYNIDDVMKLMRSDASIKPMYGLPNDYIELLDWAEVYPGQFTYPTPAGAAYYVGYSVVDAIAYELESDGAGGWKMADDRDANIAYINSLTDQQIRDGALQYLEAYITELDKYIYKDETGKSWYGTNVEQPVPSINGKIVGSAENFRIGDTTVLMGMTTLISITERQSGVYEGLGLYSMDTALVDKYCWTIGEYSHHKAGAMVVANICTGPYMQGKMFEITGNMSNVNLEQFLGYLGAIPSADKTFADKNDYYLDVATGNIYINPNSQNGLLKQYTKSFGFLETWVDDAGKAGQYVTPTKLAETGVVGLLIKHQTEVNTLWTRAITH